jgi:NAD(P)-dependent dehydrogenase (short-subunit alcohol dehydrogenase family)
VVSVRYGMSGKVVLITGGGTGIGRATALAFAAEGAAVVIASRRREPGEEVVSRIKQLGGTPSGFRQMSLGRRTCRAWWKGLWSPTDCWTTPSTTQGAADAAVGSLR